ncbi:class I SAM-dependent methyltransferase [Edaphobacter albus]|uniref:class I SAM-dependent methyltransferase n=1 Tax=Edaphobacter sp. 4G125 TaxID=2763071 RepID=UPI0016463221|nr:class I SAM-dependent methyltransferase [Edaphobacter sp. 4G125]QNI37658.1 methyltransferase domain-containing protein [Edaphobacter sp. 4G125]
MITQSTYKLLHPAVIDGLKIRCPRCTARMETIEAEVPTFACIECHFPMEFKEGIWHALPVERMTYYARFIKDYEYIRTAEGRGSHDSSYYLKLPSVSRSAVNADQWKIRAITYGFLRDRILPQINSHLLAPRVLDIGAGNGWLSYRLAQMGLRPVAVDLLVNEMDGLGASAHYDSHLPQPFMRVRAECNRLPFSDAQFAAVIFNASFHYTESYERTLQEALRCLRIGGLLIIADSPWYSRQESGERMLAERHSHFFSRFGIFSNSIRSQEFLTDQRLEQLARQFNLVWQRHSPNYGLRWSLRPLVARLKKHREPSTFRIYTAKKSA